MESEEDTDPFSGGGAAGKGRCGDRKRRFSEEQIKSLETMFETQAKLEPRVKMQLARELGLQPRQVAIWFQNKRARWKSKQLERQYAALRADYDALLCSFGALNKEKQLLLKQLQKLDERLKQQTSSGGDSGDASGADIEEKGGGEVGVAVKGLDLYSDEEEKKVVCVGQEEAELLYWGEPTSSGGGGGCLASGERRSYFDDEGSPEKSYEWWDFWPLTE